jgi:hypothetical protein
MLVNPAIKDLLYKGKIVRHESRAATEAPVLSEGKGRTGGKTPAPPVKETRKKENPGKKRAKKDSKSP